MVTESAASKMDRVVSARAAKLKHRELDALIHELPNGHPLRESMRHTLSKLWMFTREAFDAECAAAVEKRETNADQ